MGQVEEREGRDEDAEEEREPAEARDRARVRAAAFAGAVDDAELSCDSTDGGRQQNDDDERDAIVLDPMLATGNSSVAAIGKVKEAGARSVILVSIVAAPQGIDRVHDEYPDVHIVCAAIDRGLNEHGFIVPGLGDAGDRLYGTK